MVSEDLLMNFISGQQREIEIISKNKNLINYHPRQIYYKIKGYLDNFIKEDNYYNRLIVIPGFRGIGKSTILYQLYNYLDECNIDKEDIFFLNVDDLKSAYDCDIRTLFELYMENIQRTITVSLDKKIFLLIDEAHYDESWAKFAKLIFDKNSNIFMIITGSSALQLELNTDAMRRFTIERMYPCDFREYLYLKYDMSIQKFSLRQLLSNPDKETINNLIEFEHDLYKTLLHLPNDPFIEFKKYVHTQGLTFALDVDEFNIYSITNEMIKTIIQDDLKHYITYNKISTEDVSQIITYLAIKKSGKTSNSAIANSVNLNAKTVTKILTTLEQAQLIFKVYAYGSAGKMIKKDREHFFITSSIKSAINYKIGLYNLNNDKCFSLLVENLFASKLYILSNDILSQFGLFYDPDNKNVDFLVKYLNEIIPIEVGIGKKTKSQVIKSMKKHNSKFGIFISNRTSRVEYRDNILYVPLLTFALLS